MLLTDAQQEKTQDLYEACVRIGEYLTERLGSHTRPVDDRDRTLVAAVNQTVSVVGGVLGEILDGIREVDQDTVRWAQETMRDLQRLPRADYKDIQGDMELLRQQSTAFAIRFNVIPRIQKSY